MPRFGYLQARLGTGSTRLVSPLFLSVVPSTGDWMTDYSSSDQDIVFTHDDTSSHLVACSEPTSPPCCDPARSFRRQTLPPFSPSQISYIGTSAPGTPFHPPRRGLSRNFRSPSASPSHESLMSRTGSESVECSIQSQLGREVDAVGHGQTGEWSGARR